MTTSQLIMLVAFGCIDITWIAAWVSGHRASASQHIFGALCVQSLAAILLSFSSGSLLLSLALAGVILGAVLWMIQNGSRSSSPEAGGS